MTHASQWLEALCREHGVPREHVDRLLLCLDDALANILAHGGPTALSNPIQLHFEMHAEPQSRLASVTLSDAGIAFDPVAVPGKALPKGLDDLDAAELNGRGLQMIRAAASEFRYRRADGRNHLTFGTRWEQK